MPYLVQFVLPALIFIGIIYAFSRRQGARTSHQDDTSSIFLTILVIGAVVAVATLFAMQANWNSI